MKTPIYTTVVVIIITMCIHGVHAQSGMVGESGYTPEWFAKYQNDFNKLDVIRGASSGGIISNGTGSIDVVFHGYIGEENASQPVIIKTLYKNAVTRTLSIPVVTLDLNNGTFIFRPHLVLYHPDDTYTFEFSYGNQTVMKQYPYVFGDAKNLIYGSNYISPLRQLRLGVPVNDVACDAGLKLVIKTEDGSPACVKPETAQKLIERGWAKSPTGVSGLAMPPVGLSNLTLSAKPIILGIPFYVNAVITNHLAEPITYYGGCASPLSVSLDNIKTTADDIHCLAISKYTLGPDQSVPIQSNKIETIYNAIGPDATANAQIKLSYEVDGKQASMFTGMQIPIQNAIMIDCSGERVQLHMSQIDKTVNVTKAIVLAYSSPEFLSKVKQYGNVSYNYFNNDWFSSESCHTYWNGTEVMFTANDNNNTRNIQVTEDINQTKVLKVRDFVVTPTK